MLAYHLESPLHVGTTYNKITISKNIIASASHHFPLDIITEFIRANNKLTVVAC